MRFIAEAASTAVDLRNEQFAPQALYQMAEQADGKEIPILYEFGSERKGFVRKAYVRNNKLVVEGEFHGALTELIGSGNPLWQRWVVPGCVIRERYPEDGITTDSDVELVSFGLTNQPCDPTLKPLRKMEVKLCVAPERSSDAS